RPAEGEHPHRRPAQPHDRRAARLLLHPLLGQGVGRGIGPRDQDGARCSEGSGEAEKRPLRVLHEQVLLLQPKIFLISWTRPPASGKPIKNEGFPQIRELQPIRADAWQPAVEKEHVSAVLALGSAGGGGFAVRRLAWAERALAWPRARTTSTSRA